MRQDLRDRHGHVPAVRLLPALAVDAQLHPQVVRIADLVRSDDPRAERAERVDRLTEREDTGAHLAALDVARGDVVEDHVPADVVRRLLGAEPLAGLRDHDRELELVVELLRQMLRIDDRLVGADDCVDVLEEDDPGRDLVRPAHSLRLLLVLAKVAGRVDELFRDDRRPQLDGFERRLPARGTHVSGSLEVLPCRRYVELHDRVVAQFTDPAVVERDELHAASARRFAARSTTSRMSPLNGRTMRQ